MLRRFVDVKMVLPGDPGIFCTAMLACECARTMVDHPEALPSGFHSPVIALGRALEKRLAGVGVCVHTGPLRSGSLGEVDAKTEAIALNTFAEVHKEE